MKILLFLVKFYCVLISFFSYLQASFQLIRIIFPRSFYLSLVLKHRSNRSKIIFFLVVEHLTNWLESFFPSNFIFLLSSEIFSIDSTYFSVVIKNSRYIRISFFFLIPVCWHFYNHVWRHFLCIRTFLIGFHK